MNRIDPGFRRKASSRLAWSLGSNECASGLHGAAAFVKVDSSITVPSAGGLKTHGSSCLEFLGMVGLSKEVWFVSAQPEN